MTTTGTKTVTVLIGRTLPGALTADQPAIYWATPDMAYAFEAMYDPTHIGLRNAESRIRVQLGLRDIRVADFLNEDDKPEPSGLDKVIAALPAAVDQALRKTLPDKYSPELAAQIAQGVIAELMRQNNPDQEDGPLDPAQRTPVLDEGLGAHITAPVESALRDIDSSYSTRENEELPFLAAQMVVSEYRTQAYGRRTEVWLHYGRTTGALTPAEAREALDAMREFVDRFEAVVDLAEETAAGDFEGDEEIARLDREYTGRRIAARSAELLAAKDRA